MAEVSYIGLAALEAKAMAAVVGAVNSSLEHLTGKSIEAETAVVSGNLRSSIHSTGALAAGFFVSGRVQTGGEADAYAAYIHEGHRRDGSHIIGAYPGGLQYIRKPLLENRDFYVVAMERAAREEF